MTECKGR